MEFLLILQGFMLTLQSYSLPCPTEGALRLACVEGGVTIYKSSSYIFYGPGAPRMFSLLTICLRAFLSQLKAFDIYGKGKTKR